MNARDRIKSRFSLKVFISALLKVCFIWAAMPVLFVGVVFSEIIGLASWEQLPIFITIGSGDPKLMTFSPSIGKFLMIAPLVVLVSLLWYAVKDALKGIKERKASRGSR